MFSVSIWNKLKVFIKFKRKMSEPRCCLVNVGSNKYLTCKDDWSVGMTDGYNGGNESFKLQWSKRNNDGIVTTTMIRTDCHPQSLLDCRDLCFQGGALDSNKCYDQHRWWDVVLLNLKPDGEKSIRFVVALKSATTNEFLGASDYGVHLKSFTNDTPLDDIPSNYRWEIYVSGRALSPGQVTFIVFSPLVIAIAAFGGAGAVVGIYGLEATVGGVSAVTVGGVLGALGAVGETVKAALIEVSKEMFVDW